MCVKIERECVCVCVREKVSEREGVRESVCVCWLCDVCAGCVLCYVCGGCVIVCVMCVLAV